jgi:hypothetical protein
MALTIAAMAKRMAGMAAARVGLSVVNTKVVSRIPAATLGENDNLQRLVHDCKAPNV